MRRGFAAAVMLLLLAGVGSSASAANIHMFNDPAVVDVANEAAALRSALEGLGHTVTTFTGLADSAWIDAFAASDLVVIPDQEVGDLFGLMAAPARFALHSYVLSGGGLILHGTTGISRLETLVNGLWTSLLVPDAPTNPGILDGAAAAGTAFEGGPPSVPFFSSVAGHKSSSLPGGARSIYADAGSSVLSILAPGAGRVVVVGFDWGFTAPTPPAWINVLGRAVTHVMGARPLASNVAVLVDSDYVDTSAGSTLGEALIISANLTSLGFSVTEFEGVSADSLAAALVGQNMLLIPENEGNNLADSLTVEAQEVIRNFVSAGGTFLNCNTNSATGRGQQLHALLFGTTATEGLSANTVQNASLVAGTAFERGPATLATPSATITTSTPSLPPFSLNAYSSGGTCSIWAAPFGNGRALNLAWDWFKSGGAPPNLDWSMALASCVEYGMTAGPGVVLPPTTGPEGVNTNVSAVTSVDVTASTATLSFRAGGQTAFATVPMTESTPGTFVGQVDGSIMDVRGVQYSVEIADASNNTLTTPLASLSVSVTDSPIASLAAGAHDLLGVPLNAANTDPVAVFDEFGGVYDNSVWRYGTRNASDTGYDEPGGAAPATPGQGFWLIARDATVVRVSGISSNLVGNTAVRLHQGWNQISNPFGFPIDSDDVILPTAVSRNFWSWDGTTHQFAASTTMAPREGFWLENTSAGTQQIEFPPIGGSAALRSDPTIPGVLPDDVAGWSVEVAATVGAVNDRNNRFGMREDGTADRDAFDFGDPPQPPSSYAAVSFLTDRGKALLTDYRSDTAEGATWDLILHSDLAGEAFRVDFTTERSLPAGWTLVALGGSGGERVDLTNTPSLSGLVTSDAFQTTWKIVAGPPEYVAEIQADLLSGISSFAFSVPRPNPIRSGYGTTFDFAAPQATRVNIRMFDVSGRLVRNLLQGPVNRGEHRVYWDGTDGSGRRAAAGVYFVKVQTDGFSTTRKVTVLN